MSKLVVDMGRIEEGDEHIDIEKGAQSGFLVNELFDELYRNDSVTRLEKLKAVSSPLRLCRASSLKRSACELGENFTSGAPLRSSEFLDRR